MKKTLLVLVTLIAGLVITFFLNSNFRNLIINVGTSTSTDEALHQLGKRSAPLMHLNGTIKQYEENKTSIINNYKLMILNHNKNQGIYKINIIDDDLYTHSIHNPISLEASEKKIISFNIQTSKINKDTKQRIKQITLRVIDTEHPELFVDDKIGFILKAY